MEEENWERVQVGHRDEGSGVRKERLFVGSYLKLENSIRVIEEHGRRE